MKHQRSKRVDLQSFTGVQGGITVFQAQERCLDVYGFGQNSLQQGVLELLA